MVKRVLDEVSCQECSGGTVWSMMFWVERWVKRVLDGMSGQESSGWNMWSSGF